MNANLQRFTGFADTYDRYRPALPVVIREILAQLAGDAHPFRVIGILADRVVPWWWSYRIRVGIKMPVVK
ncbi:MAG: hypothetical protein JO015_04405 [Verrucomicrobia bacterium]|nr:hypothetical protein [Verrucomicrobiota bacterium]